MPSIKILFFLLLFASPVIAQWNDGYEPEIGMPGVIDTLYGALNQQNFGDGMINVGPKPGKSFGRIWFSGIGPGPALTGSSFYYEVEGGPTLEFKKLRQKASKIQMKFEHRNYFGSIASQNSRDRLIIGDGNVPTIYWQDETGDYDTANTTLLLTEWSPSDEYHDFYGSLLYSTFLTSDTVHDIVSVVIRLYQNDKPDSIFAVLYKGGAALSGRREALPSEILCMGEYFPKTSWPKTQTQGDWRGTSRDDLITADLQSKAYFHFRNEKPFSLANFIRSLEYDTLLVLPDTGRLDVEETLSLFSNALTMRACPRSSSNSSADLIFTTYKQGEGRRIRVFRGHDQFGSNRLTYDSAALTIKLPRSPFDGFGIDNTFRDLGDMTGTGNRVFYSCISQDAGFRAYHLFYVMGDAMDDTADMAYFVEPYGRAWVDTITANGDNLQDAILGIPEYYSKRDLDLEKTGVGTIHLLYGSTKIPVKGKSGVSNHDAENLSLEVYPNPCLGKMTARLSNLNSPTLDFTIRDVLGRLVYRRSFEVLASMQEMTLDLSSLGAGGYLFQVTCGDRSVRTSLRILPH